MSRPPRNPAAAAATFVRDIARDTWDQVEEAQLFTVASSLAYTTILSIIPALAVSFAVFRALGGLTRLYDIVQPIILANLTEGAGAEAVERLKQFIDQAHANALGIGGFVGLVVTTMSMLWNIEKAFNRVWETPVRTGWLRRFAAYWLFVAVGPLALAVAMGFATSANLPLTSYLPSGTGSFLVAIVVFFLAYLGVPSTPVRWPYALQAAVVTASLWAAARAGYAYYAAHIVAYGKIYGSLGAVPVTLLWLYIVWVVILVGSALSAALQRRAECGTREGSRYCPPVARAVAPPAPKVAAPEFRPSPFLVALEAIARKASAADPAHDFSHVERVRANALRLAATEGGDTEVLVAAAYLHDIANLPKDHPDSRLSSERSAAAAGTIARKLRDEGGPPTAGAFDERRLALLHDAILCHSYSRGLAPQTPEGRIFQDADRLDGLGAIGVARTFTVGGSTHRPLYAPSDPFCVARAPDDRQNTIDHFYAKLFKLSDTMLTEAGRREAHARTARMQAFLTELAGEIGG